MPVIVRIGSGCNKLFIDKSNVCARACENMCVVTCEYVFFTCGPNRLKKKTITHASSTCSKCAIRMCVYGIFWIIPHTWTATIAQDVKTEYIAIWKIHPMASYTATAYGWTLCIASQACDLSAFVDNSHRISEPTRTVTIVVNKCLYTYIYICW